MATHTLADLLGRTLVLMAHPDDECLTAGTLLQRISEPYVLYATNGAPHDPYFWHAYGSREAYRELRRSEAQHALAQVGVHHLEFLSDDHGFEDVFVDQALFRALPQALERIADRVSRIRPEAIFTLAYEGGHPDHDSCSLLASVLGREYGIPVWEAPLYHRAGGGNAMPRVTQEFMETTGAEIHLVASEEQLARKAAMCAEYRSQGDFLKIFRIDREVLRPQATYDYTRPPHEGQLNYEKWQWSMTGAEVSQAFHQFLAARSSASEGRATSFLEK